MKLAQANIDPGPYRYGLLAHHELLVRPMVLLVQRSAVPRAAPRLRLMVDSMDAPKVCASG